VYLPACSSYGRAVTVREESGLFFVVLIFLTLLVSERTVTRLSFSGSNISAKRALYASRPTNAELRTRFFLPPKRFASSCLFF